MERGILWALVIALVGANVYMVGRVVSVERNLSNLEDSYTTSAFEQAAMNSRLRSVESRAETSWQQLLQLQLETGINLADDEYGF